METTMTRETLKLEKRSGLSYDEFKNEYLFPLKPVVFKDAAKDWKAIGKFTPEFFKKNYGHVVKNMAGRDYTLAEFIDLMMNSDESNPAPYPCKIDVMKYMPDLIPDISPKLRYTLPNRIGNPLIPKGFLGGADTFELFFGGVNGWFPYIHYDYMHLHAFITQVYGDKEFIIYTPDQEKYLYIDKNEPWQSLVEKYWEPDYAKFPLFANAKPTKVIVSAGETLFIPCGWWHTARSVTPTISVAYDLLNASNWSQFCDDVEFMVKRFHPAKAKLIGAYLKSSGAMMRMAGL
jgi:histone arginine demethylase JMJD6